MVNKNMNTEYWANDPETYGIVYKGSNEVIVYDKKPQYFRSIDTATWFLPFFESIFFDSDLEIKKLKKSIRERLMKEAKDDFERSSKVKIKESKFLNYLKENQEEYEEMLEMRKEYKKKRPKEKNVEMMF